MHHENQSSIYFQYIMTGYLRLFSEAVPTPSSGRITIYFGENYIIVQNNSYFRSRGPPTWTPISYTPLAT